MTLDFAQLLKDKVPKYWSKKESAPFQEIRDLMEQSPFELPSEYLEFLRFSNGAYAELPVLPFWCDLFPAAEVMVCNRDDEVLECLTNYLSIGSSGGGELILLSKLSPGQVYTVRVPFSSDEDILPVAPTFLDFVLMLGFSEGGES